MTKRTIRTVRLILKRNRRKKLTWSQAAMAAGIVKADGSPDPGMAYKILQYNKEPTDPATRERLELKRICPSCLRPLAPRHSHQVASPDRAEPGLPSPEQRWWKSLSSEEKLRIIKAAYNIEHRRQQ